MSDIKVSIIVPVYNAARYLPRLIESILHQTMIEWEAIFVNDGSTDLSLQVIESYAKKENRIKVVDKKNGGVSKARNIGLEMAKGKYIAFWDADDFFWEKCLEILYKEAEQEQVDIISSGNYIYWPKTGKTQRMFAYSREILNQPEALRELIENRHIGMSCGSKLFLKDTIKNVRFSEEYHTFEDRLFIFDAIRNANKILIIPDAFYYYCMNDDSVSHIGFSPVRSKGLEIMDIMYEHIKKEYPQLEPYSYADVIRMKYVVLGTLYEDAQWKKFPKEYKKIKSEIQKAELNKIKNYIQKTTYYQIVAIKYIEPVYRLIKQWYIGRQKRKSVV